MEQHRTNQISVENRDNLVLKFMFTLIFSSPVLEFQGVKNFTKVKSRELTFFQKILIQFIKNVLTDF